MVEFLEERLKDFANETRNNSVLSKVFQYCDTNWPSAEFYGGLNHFKKLQNSIPIEDNLLYYEVHL